MQPAFGAHAIETLGTLSVGAMVLCYARESRSPRYIAGFALACASSAVYAALIRAWPFAFAEALWFLIACQRWKRAQGVPNEK